MYSESIWAKSLSKITRVISLPSKLQNWVITGLKHFKTFPYSEAQQYSKMEYSGLKGPQLLTIFSIFQQVLLQQSRQKVSQNGNGFPICLVILSHLFLSSNSFLGLNPPHLKRSQEASLKPTRVQLGHPFQTALR